MKLKIWMKGFIITTCIISTLNAVKSLNISLFQSEKMFLSSGEEGTIYLPSTIQKSLFGIFHQISIEVSGTKRNGGEYLFPFHSVRGISTDDGHHHIQNAFQKLFQYFQIQNSLHHTSAQSVRSFIRDIFSSCPSPIFGNGYRNFCRLHFSPYGDATVTVKSNDYVTIYILAKHKFNIFLIVKLLIGILFLSLAHTFSKSKIFQYTCGAVVFVIGGILVGLLSVTGTISTKKKLVQNTSLLALFTGAYGATLVWFLREHVSRIMIDFWEISIAYVIITSGLGFLFVRFIRSNENTKHVFRVTTKWALRVTGAWLVFNASASPTLSLIYASSLLIFYLLHALHKSAVKKIFAK